MLPLKLRLAAIQDKPDCYEIDEYTVSFNGVCEECRPYCQALCCSTYKFVALSEEEAKSGRYDYIEASAGCDCENCTEMRQAGIQYSLIKNSCSYLDENKRCGIYEYRPQTCRHYNCSGLIIPLQPEI